VSKVSDFRAQKNGQPYTIRVQRSLADHTVIDASFIEPDDARATERLALLCEAMDARMIAVNEKILSSKAHMDALIEAKAKEREKTTAFAPIRPQGMTDAEFSAWLNGGSDADSHRPADVPTDS
jgi:hypothetical protein